MGQSSFQRWLSETTDKILRAADVASDKADCHALLEMVIAERMREMPLNLLHELALRYAQPGAGQDAHSAATDALWRHGERVALEARQWPPVLKAASEKKCRQVSAAWFRSKTGAELGRDLVEFGGPTLRGRRVIVCDVCIRPATQILELRARANMTVRLLKPSSPLQEFVYLQGDPIRKVARHEMKRSEVRLMKLLQGP